LQLGARLIAHFSILAAATLAWAAAVFAVRPSSYVRLLAGLSLLSMAFVHVAILWTYLVNFAVIITALITPGGICAFCLAYLGEWRSKTQQVRAMQLVCKTGVWLLC
jgi:hypothetical protein